MPAEFTLEDPEYIAEPLTHSRDLIYSPHMAFSNNTRTALDISHDFGAFTLTSVTGFESGERRINRDADSTPIVGIRLRASSLSGSRSSRKRVISSTSSYARSPFLEVGVVATFEPGEARFDPQPGGL